jgi:hypothetical protein
MSEHNNEQGIEINQDDHRMSLPLERNLAKAFRVICHIFIFLC